MLKLDKKNYEILRILDRDFRSSFSKIAKKVGLSKNSVRLRFHKLKGYMLHNTAGINNKLLGYTLVKFFYAIDYFNEDMERRLINELKKQNKLAYAARHYGHYNLEIGVFVRDFDELNEQIKQFNQRFSKIISEKEIEIIVKEFFFGNNFLQGKRAIGNIIMDVKSKVELAKIDKKILSILSNDPRASIINISSKISLDPRTVISHIKEMEKLKVITGYFMMLDYSKFNLSPFKILLQVSNSVSEEEFEKYIYCIDNVKHFSRTLGFWDYEIDLLSGSIIELQQQIEMIKHDFPGHIKKLEIMSHGKRILTNRNSLL